MNLSSKMTSLFMNLSMTWQMTSPTSASSPRITSPSYAWTCQQKWRHPLLCMNLPMIPVLSNYIVMHEPIIKKDVTPNDIINPLIMYEPVRKNINSNGITRRNAWIAVMSCLSCHLRVFHCSFIQIQAYPFTNHQNDVTLKNVVTPQWPLVNSSRAR